jgi:hypothetical protein
MPHNVSLVGVAILIGVIALVFTRVKLKGVAYIAILASCLILGLLTYGVLGIVIARILGGRFCSVPFGGFHVGDAALVSSVIFWQCAWVFIFFFKRIMKILNIRMKGDL